MKRPIVVVLVGIGLAALFGTYRTEAQPEASQQGQSIPGCDIPKQYGRLITVTAGNNNGLAGQAVFEAEDGTIRWVPFMFNSREVIMQKPASRPMAANFPVLPLYECVLGHVWERR